MGARKQMTELDSALDRLSDAVDQLIASAGQTGPDRESEARIARLNAERDGLRAEVQQLRAQHDEDARLRAEAADAVRAALTDLRSVVAVQGDDDG
jgi:ElaB/YqjD/DUF883 family membrane-anchored ribosome-binding protein